MKVILSRKGFDSSNGGHPSPIMPDGSLLSIPVPNKGDDPSKFDELTYSDLCFNGESYASILNKLYPGENWNNRHCHNDPDIRKNRADIPPDWKPAFGQAGSAQGLLKNADVKAGDLFLFFGWFRRIDDKFRFINRRIGNFYDHSDLHVIYGYMQIGRILTKRDNYEEIATFTSHPHSRYSAPSNALYLPSERLSFDDSIPGYGMLSYREDRVLTKEGCSRSIWQERDFLMPGNKNVYPEKKNSAKKSGLYYAGIWQELIVMNESESLLDWVKSIIKP